MLNTFPLYIPRLKIVILFFQISLFRNKAIADYLASNGYTGTLAEFQKEADMVSNVK